MNYLQKDEIIFINQKTIERHGGNFIAPYNILNENPLDYVVAAVSAEMFGEPLYTEIWDKAAVYFHTIITGHIFHEGNKRIGLEATLAFLKLNDFQLNNTLRKVELETAIHHIEGKIVPAEGKVIPQEGNNTGEILINFTLEAASGLLQLDDCKIWIKENIDIIVVPNIETSDKY